MTMQSPSIADLDAVAARHPHLLTPSFWSRFRIPVILTGGILYLAFCSWLFSVPQVMSSANWTIAGSYLADWVSYEERPTIAIRDDATMKVEFSRFDPIGPNPNPDWLQAKRETITRTITAPAAAAQPSAPASTFSFMAPAPASAGTGDAAPASQTVSEEVVTHAVVQMNPEATIEVAPPGVTVTRAGETLAISLGQDSVRASTALPEWATQRAPGEKIVVSFGFSGWAEVRSDAVIVHKRYLGWPGFLFDIDSPYFGKPLSEVLTLIRSDERLNPARSNLQLAIDNILYNPSWQHLDVWTKLFQTIVMAFVGTLFASIIAFPLSFIAARNITLNRPVNQLVKRFFDFQRSVDMLIWALFFTRAFGPGPLAGISAIFFTDTGTLGKLYSEALENIDDKQREGIKSVGAPPLAVQRFGVLPQVLPVFASQALYFWESNTRSATIIGAVGAGGIGLKLWEAMRTNTNWKNVAYMVILILIVVFIFDAISNALRSRLIGKRGH
jgi:phosphonate transport system permease protein